MPLKFAELRKLERILIHEGSSKDASEILPETSLWLNSSHVPEHFNEPIAKLAAVTRNLENKRAAEIALGALAFVRRELKNNESRCLAVLRFAQQRVEAIKDDGNYWANVILDADDEENARALFEAAIGDTSYSEQDLINTARAFVQSHNEANSIFGRLAADLDVLVGILEDASSDEYVEIARAALTYFAETADAIPDDLGILGLLDDVYIVQQAVNKIRLGRASLTAYLEDRIRRWPFLKNLEFTVDGRPTPASDYILANSALLLDVLEPNASSTVVLVPDAGPLPYLLGFVATLAQMSKVVKSDGAILQRGDRLIDRDGKGEVVFKGYLREEDLTLVSCDPQLATHVEVVHPAKGRKPEMLHKIPIAELGNFRQTAMGDNQRRRSTSNINIDEREAGPLEQLFGSSTPLPFLDPHLPFVLVVAPIETTKRLSKDLELFGVAARDVVPTGQLRREEDGFDISRWSTLGTGGEPILCVVRSVDEAYEVVASSPFESRRVSAVVTTVQPGSADVSQLVRIVELGVGVLAFVAPEDSDTLEVFADRDLSFWSWDKDWFELLYRPRVEASTEHTLIAYERDLNQRFRVTNQVEMVQLDELSELTTLLGTMGQGHNADNEPLMNWVRQAWWILPRFFRCLTPITQDALVEFEKAIGNLASARRANQYRWSEESMNDGAKIVELFERTLMMLAQCNPKHERLISLATENPGATVWVPQRDRALVTEELADAEVRVLSGNVSEGEQTFRIIPAWYGRSRMEALAFASSYERQTLLLYDPEVEWFRKAKQRHERTISKTRELATRYSAIPIDKQEYSPPHLVPVVGSRFDDLDEVLRKSIYSFVDQTRRDTDEQVSATVVGFVGGSWAAFTPAHRIVVVSHLINAQGGDDEVESTIVADLRVGDTILLLRGSDRDAIRERANLSLSEETISAADTWKRALRTYVKANPSLEDLRQKLSRAGCEKSVQTIRTWISNDYAIGPQQAPSVIAAIAETTGSTELFAGQEKCLVAIRAVRGAHSAAGRWLAKRVIERAREWAEAGATPDDLVELEDQLVMVTVDFVDASQTEVPTHLVNQLQSSPWHG